MKVYSVRDYIVQQYDYRNKTFSQIRSLLVSGGYTRKDGYNYTYADVKTMYHQHKNDLKNLEIHQDREKRTQEIAAKQEANEKEHQRRLDLEEWTDEVLGKCDKCNSGLCKKVLTHWTHHYAKSQCEKCGAFHKWLPNPNKQNQ